jgi:predicted DNA-binding protein
MGRSDQEVVTVGPVKALTLRLPVEQAAELEAVARADNVPVATEIREAITAHIAAKRKDAAFRERLERLMRENREILERLAE